MAVPINLDRNSDLVTLNESSLPPSLDRSSFKPIKLIQRPDQIVLPLCISARLGLATGQARERAEWRGEDVLSADVARRGSDVIFGNGSGRRGGEESSELGGRGMLVCALA